MNIDGIIVPGMYGVFDSLQPAIGYNWGAGRKDRSSRIAVRCVSALALMCLAFTLILEFFPSSIFSLFLQTDKEELALAVHAIRIMGLTYLVRWISYSGQSFSSAIGKSGEATLLSICNALIFPILMMFILKDSGVEGLWLVTPSVAVLSAVAAILIYIMRIRRLMKSR